MNNKIRNRWDLMQFLNQSDLKDLEDEIAKYIYENIDDVSKKKNVSKIAEDSFFSQPSLSRFFLNTSKLTYNDFKSNDLIAKNEHKNYYNFLRESFGSKNLDDIIEKISQKEIEKAEKIKLKNSYDIERIIKLFNSSRKIVFIGERDVLPIVFGLQSVLLYNGIISYAPLYNMLLKEIINQLEENDLVVVIDIGIRWKSESLLHEYINILKDKNCKKMLWSSFVSQEDSLFTMVFRFDKTNSIDSLYDFQFFLRILHTYYAVNLDE